MEPLINSFTKNLSGCSGCGNNAKEKGDVDDKVYDFFERQQKQKAEEKTQINERPN